MHQDSRCFRFNKVKVRGSISGVHNKSWSTLRYTFCGRKNSLLGMLITNSILWLSANLSFQQIHLFYPFCSTINFEAYTVLSIGMVNHSQKSHKIDEVRFGVYMFLRYMQQEATLLTRNSHVAWKNES